MESPTARANDTASPSLVARFDNRWARELPDLGIFWAPHPSPAPRWLALNTALADELGLDARALAAEDGLAFLSGRKLPDGAQPLAQAYAGHQFGGLSPQLGDGRALLIGEIVDRHGQRRDLAFKGSGRTPFSRGGDGKAAVGPVLREYLMGEALHALGIPTTRALAAVATGETVRRETSLPGALLTRVASSHLRVGTFQFHALRGDIDRLRRLADHALSRHEPRAAAHPDRYGLLLDAVCARQAELVAQWMGVGFIHGVMNTDNMTISGETLDFGPCAFVEAHDPAAVFSSIDHHGRYAFGNQPGIAQWNLARLAEALLPLVDPDPDKALERVKQPIDAFPDRYADAWLEVLRRKLGLPKAPAEDVLELGNRWQQLMHSQQVDHTLGFRRLADAADNQPQPLLAMFTDPRPVKDWLSDWQACAAAAGDATNALASDLRQANPRVIARNHRVEAALARAVDTLELEPFQELLAAVQHPFDDDARWDEFAVPAPASVTAVYQTFCGT